MSEKPPQILGEGERNDRSNFSDRDAAAWADFHKEFPGFADDKNLTKTERERLFATWRTKRAAKELKEAAQATEKELEEAA